MIKLTLTSDGGFLYVWPHHIAIEGSTAHGTSVYIHGYGRTVVETPEEILAMPAMRAEIDRARLTDKPPMNIGSLQHPCFHIP